MTFNLIILMLHYFHHTSIFDILEAFFPRFFENSQNDVLTLSSIIKLKVPGFWGNIDTFV
jgi:hypothetical protein